MSTKAKFLTVCGALIMVALVTSCRIEASTGQSAAAPQTAVAKSIGVIRAINGKVITLAAESGAEMRATVQPNARILRLAAGEKDLKNATPVQLTDLQVGDTIRVRGAASDDQKSISAMEVLVITRSAVNAVADQIRQDWQKRGMGGLVTAVDPAIRTVTISVTGFGGTKSIAVHASRNTVFRRYAPESVKFEDAKPGTLEQIRIGDQLRARGTRGTDGTEFTAEEIVTGTFRNVAGTVNSLDATGGTINIQDLLTKKSVQIKVTPDSELHKIPAEIAQRMASRLKAMMPGGVPGGSANSASSTAVGNPPASGQGGGMRSGGPPDFQQLLNRMPAVTLADLHKGDAVMLVATQGSASNPSTAITLLSGVEPILQAAPTASSALMLAPWSLGNVPGGEAGSQ
jgi:hypothetical protein